MLKLQLHNVDFLLQLQGITPCFEKCYVPAFSGNHIWTHPNKGNSSQVCGENVTSGLCDSDFKNALDIFTVCQPHHNSKSLLHLYKDTRDAYLYTKSFAQRHSLFYKFFNSASYKNNLQVSCLCLEWHTGAQDYVSRGAFHTYHNTMVVGMHLKLMTW